MAGGIHKLAGIAVAFLAFVLPGLILGDMAWLAVWCYVSFPVGGLLGYFVSSATRRWMDDAIDSEIRRPVPDRGRPLARIIVVLVFALVIGGGALIWASMTKHSFG